MSKKSKEEKPDQPAADTIKTIQTMLRLTSQNHMQLSEMADKKANILIGVTAIIISVILSVLARKLSESPNLTIPTLIFLISSLATMVLAIFSTLPKITQGKFSRNQILNRQTNLLFFGNFHKESLDEYKWGMGVMMRDADYLYGALVDDIYYLGVVLGRKYRMLRMAYNIFMIGIIVSTIAFIIAVTFFKPSHLQ
jgi:MFS-type transporter involved in bile tolerance (Atg22 family)